MTLSQALKTARHIGPCQAVQSRKTEMRLTETPAPRIDHSRPAAFRPLPLSAQWGRACCRGHALMKRTSQSHTPLSLFTSSPFFVLDPLPEPHQSHHFPSGQASTAPLPLLPKEHITVRHETASAKLKSSVIQSPVCRVWPPNHLHNSGLESCKCIRKWRISAPKLTSPGRSNNAFTTGGDR